MSKNCDEGDCTDGTVMSRPTYLKRPGKDRGWRVGPKEDDKRLEEDNRRGGRPRCLSCIRASTSRGPVVPSTAREAWEDDDGRPKRVSRHAGALWRCSCRVTLASGVSMMQRSDWVDLITGQMVVWMVSSRWKVAAALLQLRA